MNHSVFFSSAYGDIKLAHLPSYLTWLWWRLCHRNSPCIARNSGGSGL